MDTTSTKRLQLARRLATLDPGYFGDGHTADLWICDIPGATEVDRLSAMEDIELIAFVQRFRPLTRKNPHRKWM